MANFTNSTQWTGSGTLTKQSGTVLTISTKDKYVDKDIKMTLGVRSGSATVSATGSATISSANFAYNTNNGNFNLTGSANISGTATASVGTAGWISSIDNGSVSGTANLSATVAKIGIKAAMRGVKVVMSPMRYCYIDEGQTIYYDEPDVWPGFVPIELVYCYDPVPEEVLAAGKADLVMGFEACLWTFYAYNQRIRDTQCWPRTCAVAEVAWSDPERKNLVDFGRRVNATKRYLDSLGVDYYDKKKDYSDYDLSEKDDIPTVEKVKERSRQLKALRTGKKTSR